MQQQITTVVLNKHGLVLLSFKNDTKRIRFIYLPPHFIYFLSICVTELMELNEQSLNLISVLYPLPKQGVIIRVWRKPLAVAHWLSRLAAL